MTPVPNPVLAFPLTLSRQIFVLFELRQPLWAYSLWRNGRVVATMRGLVQSRGGKGPWISEFLLILEKFDNEKIFEYNSIVDKIRTAFKQAQVAERGK